MCFSVREVPGWLISPVALMRSQGMDVGPLKYIDPTSWLAVDQDETREKKEEKEFRKNDAAWQRYYASRDKAATTSQLLTARENGGEDNAAGNATAPASSIFASGQKKQTHGGL